MTDRSRLLQTTPTGTVSDMRCVELAGASVHYRLVRSRRRTIAIHIGHAGVEARAPLSASVAEIESFMRRKQDWITSRLEDMGESPVFEWQSGAELPLLGTRVTLVAAPQRSGIALENDRLLIGRAGNRARADSHWRKPVLAWIHEQALGYFTQRCSALAPRLGVDAPQVRLSNAAMRWGSCTLHPAGARIRLHWKLYLLPPHLGDYVIAHELAHILELNHSARFWAQVARLYPDYGAARRELNRCGRALPLL
jgi:predicted metal-dependent hydrolase